MPKKVRTESKSNKLENPTKLDWKKKRRQEHLEKKRYRYYIFCEGEQTEPQYFTGFKRMIEDNPIYRDMVLIEIEPCRKKVRTRYLVSVIPPLDISYNSKKYPTRYSFEGLY